MSIYPSSTKVNFQPKDTSSFGKVLELTKKRACPVEEETPPQVFKKRRINDLTLSRKEIDETIKKINKHKLYHGTSSKSARSLRKHGFTLSKKEEKGCERLLSEKRNSSSEDSEAKKHHYLTTDKTEAAKYAKMHKKPTIVRVIVPNNNILKKDPQSDSDTALRTNTEIENYFVLPKKEKNLKTKQLNKITRKLHLPKIDESDKEAFKEIRDNILNSPRRDSEIFKSTKSFLEEENERTVKIVNFSKKKFGLNFENFNTGKSIELSLNPDDLEALGFFDS